MKRFKKLICLIVAVATLSSAMMANACTVIAAGKEATADGSTMVTHTCDGRYDNRVQIIPGGTHAEGEMVEIYRDPCMDTIYPVEKVGEIPQVAETYTYVNVGYPFLNEKGIAIGEHTWSGDYASFYNSEQALFVIANLEMLGLQRASTAREFIQVVGALAEEYGYADGGECLAVADPNEVWIFEIVGPGPLWTPDSGTPGAHWVARRVPDDEVWSGANRSTIGVIDFDDTENFMWSTDITAYPEQLGLWSEGEPFNWTFITDTVEGNIAYTCSARVWRVFDLIAPSLELPIANGEQAAESYPFSVVPDEEVTIQQLMEINRDHYEDTPYDATAGLAAGPFGSPVRYSLAPGDSPEEVANFSWPRTIAVKQCSYSFVAQCRDWLPAEIGTVLWFGEDSPDTTVHVPIYAGTTEVPVEWYTSDRNNFDMDSAWWAFNLVNNWATLRWDTMYEEISAKRDELMNAMYEQQPEVEAEALALYEAGDVDGAKAVLTNFSYTTMENTLDAWWEFAWHLIGKYHDGNVLTEEGNLNPGYPTEWLEAVGYAQDQLADYEVYLAESGQATEEEPAEPETTEPETTEPEMTAPETTAPETAGSNTTAIIIGVIVVVVIAVAAYFIVKNKKKS